MQVTLRRFVPGILVSLALITLVFTIIHRTANSSREPTVASMYEEYRKDFPGVRELTVNEFLKMKSERQVILVDVRTEAERTVSIIPDAISEDEFNANRDRYQNLPVVAYCTIGFRSGLFAKRMAGIHVYNLIGGVLAWAAAGQSFSNTNGPTRRVHVYGEKWNLLPEGYSAVW